MRTWFKQRFVKFAIPFLQFNGTFHFFHLQKKVFPVLGFVFSFRFITFADESNHPQVERSHYFPKLLINMAYSDNKGAQGIALMAERDEASVKQLLQESVLDVIPYLAKSEDLVIQQLGYRIIAALSAKECSRRIVLDSFINLFKNCNLGDTLIAKSVAKSISELSGHMEGEIILEKGCLRLLQKLCESNDHEIHQLVGDSIYNLCKNESIGKALIEGGALQTLHKLSKKQDVPIFVAKSIAELCKSDELKSIIVGDNWLQTLEKWAKSENKELRLLTANALSYIMEKDDLAVVVMRKLGVDIFLSLADIFDIDVQHVVERVFNNLQRRKLSEGYGKQIQIITDDFKIKNCN